MPRDYLRQMFGPGVDAALEAYVAPSRELLAVLALFRVTQTIIFRYEIVQGPKVYETEINGKPWEIVNDTVIGYDRDGQMEHADARSLEHCLLAACGSPAAPRLTRRHHY